MNVDSSLRCIRRSITVTTLILGMLHLGVHASPLITVVARTGTPAPAENVGVNFREFNGLEINSSGRVMFGAHVDPSSNTLDGIWMNDGNATVRVAKAATQAPGMPVGVKFVSLNLSAGMGPYIGDGDRVTFWGMTTTGTGGVTTDNNIAIWQGPPGLPAPIYRTGNSAPGTSVGTLFSDFDGLVSNNNGQIGFRGFLKVGGDVSTANNVGIWADDPSAGLRLIVREGSVAPGAGGVRTFQASESSGDLMPFSSLKLSDHGQIVFGGRLNDDTRGVWMGDTNGAYLVALGNTQAPDTPIGAFFDKRSLGGGEGRRYSVSPEGNFGFASVLTAGVGGVTSANQHGLWARIGTVVSLVAREGSLAPGMASGVNFSYSGSNPFDGAAVNDAGEVVFKAFVVGGPGITAGNDSAVWTGKLNTLKPVVREGGLAPGAPAGFVFGDLGTVRPVLNELGQFAFLADAQDTAGTQILRGLWAWDPGNGLLKIASEGDVLELAPGVTRTIRTIHGNFDAASAGSRSLNDVGQLAFSAEFTDGSQAILTTQVPEPNAVLLLSCGAFLLTPCRLRTALTFPQSGTTSKAKFINSSPCSIYFGTRSRTETTQRRL